MTPKRLKCHFWRANSHSKGWESLWPNNCNQIGTGSSDGVGPRPSALSGSNRDDFLCKTNGTAPANFFQRGKRNVRMVEGIPSNSAAIIDGKSLVQKVNTDR